MAGREVNRTAALARRKPRDSEPRSARTADLELVARVQGKVTEILEATVADGLDKIGRILLQELYGNSLEAYRSTNPRKHASLQLLLRTCGGVEFPVKRTVLTDALQLAAFAMELPEGSTFFALPRSHRIELLRLRSADKADELAVEILSRKTPVLELRKEVRALRQAGKTLRGRKPLPPILRALASAARALQRDTSGALRFSGQDVRELSAEHRTKLMAMATALHRSLGELIKSE